LKSFDLTHPTFAPQAQAVGASWVADAAAAAYERLEKAGPTHVATLQIPRPSRREPHLRGVLT
jgi:hypothetical protein